MSILSFFEKADHTNTLLEGFEFPSWANEVKPCCKRVIRISEQLVVFVDKNIMLDWKTSDDFDLMESKKLFQEIYYETVSIQNYIPTYINKKDRENLIVCLGEAVVAAAGGEKDLAEKILSDAKCILLRQTQEAARYFALKYSCLIFIFNFILFCTVLVFLKDFKEEAMRFFLGGVGAVMSIASDKKLINHGNIICTTKSLFIETVVKIYGGCIGGVIISYFVASGIIPVQPEAPELLYVLAIAAGFTERIIPNAIEKAPY